MKITSLKVNRIENPLGFRLGAPAISWKVTETAAKSQKAARVIVALDPGFGTIVHDSGVRVDIDSLGYRPNFKLSPRTRYYYIVTVWADNGETAQSGAAWFETAKMDEPFAAGWISPPWEDNRVHPLFRKSFFLEDEIVSARAYACGLGLYYLEIGGKRVGGEIYAPYYNTYDKWLQYQTYDITGYLAKGENTIAASLGNGWYKGRFGLGGGDCNYGSRFAFIAELRITLKNGKCIVIGTDESWSCHASPVVESGIYDGETYDARLEAPGWSENSSDAAGWDSAIPNGDMPLSLLAERRSLPVKVKHRLKPALYVSPSGEQILDMGQNMTGRVRASVAIPKGGAMRLRFGEVLQDGCFYRDNLRSAKAEYIYISNGDPASVAPEFTFFGFRYILVEGLDQVDPNDFEGEAIYSDIERIGKIETSDGQVNRLYENVVWGQRGNFLDVPTDCPQRDERLGWTGDAQVFCGTALFNTDAYAFFAKYLFDLALEQEKYDGIAPYYVPYTPRIDSVASDWGVSVAAWGDAATVIPWEAYIHSGDKAILENQFDSMRAWVDYIKRQDESSGARRLWTSGFQLGDWVALDNYDAGVKKDNVWGGTDTGFIASAYYAFSCGLVAKAAAVLGKNVEAGTYSKLAGEIRAAIETEYFTPGGRLAVTTQTAHAMSLYMGLAPGQSRHKIAEALAALLKKQNNHLTTGFVGTAYLLRALSDNGFNDLAYTLLFNDDYPSWLYEVKMGATTIWERWNSMEPDGKVSSTGMNSFNHYAYGVVAEWMYRNMCGISPVESSPGFRHANVAPAPDPRLEWARAEVDTAAGLYRSGWKIENGVVTVAIEVPFNCTADYIPYGAGAETQRLSSGSHSFTYKLE